MEIQNDFQVGLYMQSKVLKHRLWCQFCGLRMSLLISVHDCQMTHSHKTTVSWMN